MTIPELLAWCQHGEGEWWLGRLRVKWDIQAAAQQRPAAAPESLAAHRHRAVLRMEA